MIRDTLLKHLKRSVPIIAITTSDPVSLADDLGRGVADNDIQYQTVVWDTVAGYQCSDTRTWDLIQDAVNTMTMSKQKADFLTMINGCGRCNIHEMHLAIEAMCLMPSDTILVIKDADPLLKNPRIQQAILNLRDQFKQNNRAVVMIGQHFSLPPTMRSDTVIIDEPLPNRDQLRSVATKIIEAVNIDPESIDFANVIDAVSGLSYFQAEQSLALAVEPTGFGFELLYKLKKQLVNQTKGLSVHYQHQGYSSIGGLRGIKQYMTDLMQGRHPPQLIVWLDEFDKSGINHTGDSNGINADMLGTFLSYMEDTNVMGVCLHGVPGVGKSAIIKASGSEFNRLIIRLDLNAMKGSYVGESESNLRAGLRLINALGQNNVLVMATTNSLRGLDSAMMSRFRDTFFFGLPTQEELAPIWDIQRQTYGIESAERNPISTGWVGRNVKNCCDSAARFGSSLEKAARTVIPVGVSSAREIELLYQEAKNKYLCASTGEVYS